MSGNDEIWSINTDGTEQRQLTSDPAEDAAPLVSPDNKLVYFVSNRTGKAQIWKMNIDGSNQVQVTQSDGGAPIFASADGKLVYYKHAMLGTLWSVSLENGTEVAVLNQSRRHFALSPDGSMVALEDKVGDRAALAIYSIADRKTLRTFELPADRPRLTEFTWLTDGKSIMFLMSGVEYDKNALYQQSLEGGPARQIGDLGDEEISEVSGLSFSPDGKSFSVVQGGWKHDAVLLRGLR